MKRLVILLLLIVPLLASGQSLSLPTLRTITMTDGLRSNTVRALAQDSRGFIWMGTDGGLCRYDGTTVQSFTREGYANQYVSALLPWGDDLVVGTAHGISFFRARTEQFDDFTLKATDGTALTATVMALAADRDSTLWVATAGQGVFAYSQSSHRLHHYAFPRHGNQVGGIYVDALNQVYALFQYGQRTVYQLDRSTNRFIPLDDGPSAGLFCMLRLSDGRHLYGTWEQGLVMTASSSQPATASRLFTVNPADKSLYHIHALFEQRPDRILVGTDAGLFVYNPLTAAVTPFQVNGLTNFPTLPFLENPKFVYGILQDTDGGLWVSSFYGGVGYVSPIGRRFSSFTPSTSPLLKGNVISRFCEDHQHRVWIASDDGGIACYDRGQDRLIDFPARQRLSQVNAHAFWLDGDNLWIGTYASGLMVMNVKSGAVQPVTSAPQSVYALYRDSRGRLWLGGMDGALMAPGGTATFRRMHTFKSLTFDIAEDSRHNLWFATQEDGLWRLDARGRWHHYVPQAGHRSALPSLQVNDICIDTERGRVLLATPQGLCAYQQSTDSFRLLPIDAPTHNINGVIATNGALWLSTDKGILRYTEGSVQTFNRYDGIVGEQFSPGACLKASDGALYFGSLQGFTTFYPYQIKVNSHDVPVVITRLDLLNKPVMAGTERLPEALSACRRLDIYHGDNMFSLYFAALSYCSPEKNRYAYLLDGFDKEWNYTMTPKATYTNLPAGTYTFRVRATNNDGVWSRHEARLTIVVHPPLWWSWPARIFYLLLVLGAVWFYIHLRLKAAERHHRHEMQRLNERKDLEVKEARLRFFTMIAHEIRTPVSLIIGPLETIMRHVANSSGDSLLRREGDSLKMIDRNAHRLLELVNQLLDFNKVQQAGWQMHFASCRIYPLVKAVAERFAPTLQQKGCTFKVNYPPEDFTAVIDAEGITKVISNLMTNATKYTRSSVTLTVAPSAGGTASPKGAADKGTFTITVADDGLGISQADQQKIFHAFYQAQDNKPGTGIGLSIVDNIVKMHGGKVSVASELGHGATFTVVLPVSQKVEEGSEPAKPAATAAQPDDTAASATPAAVLATAAPAEPTDHPYLLLVDDNTDMLHFLADTFRGEYTIITAENGEQAWQQLGRNPVTMIISDWMMPVMDGAELCRRVRQDRRYSHLPFIMLTAKTDNASKTESMNCGADAYIEKPFSTEYLQACIRNMLQMRHRLFQKYSATPGADIAEVTPSAVDSELLQQMTKVIEEHIDSRELNVGFLAEQLHMSRSGLFAKVKAITDVTPNELIQVVRLKKAAELLSQGKYRVNEVSYMVGFSSPSYFSKCFFKQFGKKPGEFK